jgi:hypothetical protein
MVFVPQPQGRERDDQREQAHRVDQTDRVAGWHQIRVAGGEQQPHRRAEHHEVERDVDDAAPGAAGEREPRPRRQAHGARPQPVQEPADRGQEPQRERPRPAPETEHLPEQGPDHDLLVHDQLEPPVADVGQRPDAGRGGGDGQATEGVPGDLHDVHQVDRVRGAEAVVHPVLGERPDPVQVRPGPPLPQVEVREDRLDQPHGPEGYAYRRPGAVRSPAPKRPPIRPSSRAQTGHHTRPKTPEPRS